MIEYDYNVKKHTIAVKELELGINGKFKLPCGHNNAVTPNIWPFDTMICVDCKARTNFVYKIA